MAVPKKRSSKSKSRSRHATWRKNQAPSLSECDHCGAAKRSHRVCMECGYYRGRRVLNLETDEDA